MQEDFILINFPRIKAAVVNVKKFQKYHKTLVGRYNDLKNNNKNNLTNAQIRSKAWKEASSNENSSIK